MEWKVHAKIWLWSGNAAWHFVTLPKNTSAGIRAMTEGMRSPSGSVRVVVTLKGETWKTSLFPAKTLGAYILPLKAGVRKKAKVGAGDTVSLRLELDA